MKCKRCKRGPMMANDPFAYRPPGTPVHSGRGLCRQCRHSVEQEGRLDEYPRLHTTTEEWNRIAPLAWKLKDQAHTWRWIAEHFDVDRDQLAGACNRRRDARSRGKRMTFHPPRTIPMRQISAAEWDRRCRNCSSGPLAAVDSANRVRCPIRMQHAGRGLCASCHRGARTRGRLHLYPPLRRNQARLLTDAARERARLDEHGRAPSWSEVAARLGVTSHALAKARYTRRRLDRVKGIAAA